MCVARALRGQAFNDSGDGGNTKKGFALFLFHLACCFVVASCSGSEGDKEKSGEALFKAWCSPCHPYGGNIINQKKTLHKKDREANNILTAEDIIRLMRNPGPE